MKIKKLSMILLIVLTFATFYSCDGIYAIKIISNLPSNDEFTITLNGDLYSIYRLIGRDQYELIINTKYSGFSKIIDNSFIGPGVIREDIERQFWVNIKEIKIKRISDGKEYVLKKENVQVYKNGNDNIIIYINIYD